jgi:hypothetical protein
MIKNLPKKYLSTKQRKEMWSQAKKVLTKVDKELNFSEVYAIGSMVSNKKNPNDIDFAIITKMKNKKSNSSYPIDLIILPENEDLPNYLKFFEKYMKKKYGTSSKPVKLK